MKKTLLSSLLVGAMALTLTGLFAPVQAACPVKAPCDKSTAVMPVKAPPEMHIKMKEAREARKAEFEERMKLTDVQKKKIEEFQSSQEQKIQKLREKEMCVRKETAKKIESILTPEQKTELDKIKAEMREEMHKMPPKHMMMPKGDVKPCPPGCKCDKCKKH